MNNTERMPRDDRGKPDLEKLKKLKIPTRRVRMMMMQPSHFMSMFTKGLVFDKRTEIIEGLPEDAKLISIAADSARNGIMLVVESKEFDEIPINVLPPVIPIRVDIGVIRSTKKKAKRKKKR